MDLQSLLRQAITGNVADKIAEKTGATPEQVTQVIDVGLPVILGQMAKNTTTPEGAESLDTAVAKDHTGSSLQDSLSGLFENDGSNSDGGKILDHVLGTSKDTAAEKVSKQTGLSIAAVLGVLTYLAPLVMAQLGKAKQETDMNADQMADTLQKQTDGKGHPLMDIATAVLDKDKDGNIVDDLLGMFAGNKA